tara:strand:+ start:9040 stop:10482 length:1443 start_codon:yes stop_codon:yes gene_type:complete
MDKVNLDINTYTLKELENLLKLEDNYTLEDIDNKKTKLQKQITVSVINQNKKEELYIFLDNIKNKLTSEYLKLIRPNEKYNDVIKYDGNHFIIKNNNDKYSSTLENNKQINKSIIKKTFTIDSIFRSNYDNIDNKSNDYIIELPETITNAVTMSISSIEMPLTYHNISEELNNNIFQIRVRKYNLAGDNTIDYNNLDSSVDFCYNIVLIPGLYESRFTSSAQIKGADIVAQINSQLASQIVANDPNNTKEVSITSDICSNLSFKRSPQSGFGVFQYNNNAAVGVGVAGNEVVKLENGYEIIIDFNVNNDSIRNNCSENLLYQKLGWQLGYRTDKIILGDNDETTKTALDITKLNLNPPQPDVISAVSPGICHISYPRYLYIGLDDFQTSSRNYFAVASPSTIAPNIIARINILSCLEDKTAFKSAASPGDYLYTNKHIREYFGPTNIKKLKIQILDEFGRIFSINNMDWSFVASWECFYN